MCELEQYERDGLACKKACDGFLRHAAGLSGGDPHIAMGGLAMALASLAWAVDTSKDDLHQLLDIVVKQEEQSHVDA